MIVNSTYYRNFSPKKREKIKQTLIYIFGKVEFFGKIYLTYLK